MANRVSVNRAALSANFRTDPRPQGALRGATEALKVSAEANSPVRSGYFKKSFHIRKYRGGYRLYNRDPFAHLVEYGSVKNPPYSPIRRAIRTSPVRARFVDPGRSSKAQDKYDASGP